MGETPRDERRGLDDETQVIGDLGERGPAEPIELEAGVRVGRYVVTAPLGAGGMGVVYSAYDPELDRKVALKLLRTDPFGYELLRDGRTRLLREAQALAKLAHPNVVAIFDVGTFGERVFLAMELVEGQHLGQWLAAERHPWPAIVQVFLDAGAGLAAAHRAGLLHRDFKLENVVLGEDGRVRVLDFGLARLTRDFATAEPGPAVVHGEPAGNPAAWATPLSAELTVAGELVGTPAYLAPELVKGGHPDARSDQYAFCAALYRALYGQAPYQADNLLDLIRQIAEGEMRPLAPRGPGGTVPLFLRQIVKRGLARDPAERFATLDELLAALRAGRSRRRWLRRGLVAAGAAAVLAAGLWSRESRIERRCRAAGDPAAEAWSPRTRAATERAFAATGLPFARESWATVAPEVDAWVASWQEQSRLSCRATFVEQVQSEKLFELRRACLDQRLRELRALVGVWGGAEPTAIRAARSAIAELDSLDACADGRTLLAMAEPPPAQAAAVAALRGELAQVASLGLARSYGPALEQAKPLAARATALGYAPAEAEAQALVADLHDSMGQYEEAHRAYFRAYVAAQSGRHEEVAFVASHGLGWVDGYRRQDVDGGDEWVSLAAAELERLGRPARLRFRLTDLRAMLLHTRGDYAAAEALFRENLAALEQAGEGAGNPLYSDALGRIGLALEDQSRFDEARDYFLKALATHRAVFGEGHPDSSILLLFIGNTCLSQQRYREAIGYYEQSLALVVKERGEQDPETATALNNLGAAWEELGDSARAVDYYQRGLALLIVRFGPDHLDVARSQRNLADAYRLQGDLAQARQMIADAIATTGRMGEIGFRLHAYALSDLAEIEIAEQRGEPALAAIDRAFQLLGERIQPQEEALGRFIRARALWLVGRRKEAYADARASLALHRQQGAPADEVAAWIATRD